MWHEGSIGIPGKEGEMIIAHYYVKAFEEKSEWGIDEGRISKLTITIGGKTTACYDRGWDTMPDENDEPTFLAYGILLKEYN